MSIAESDLQSAAASLQSDAQAAEADLPPSCMPGVRQPYAQGLTDYAKTADDLQDSVAALDSDSWSVAVGDVAAGTKAATAGNGRLAAAGTALEAFNNGQS
jgi:hypothetical protein